MDPVIFILGLLAGSGAVLVSLYFAGAMNMTIQIPDVLMRILSSSKFWYLMVPVIANAIAAYSGHDLTGPLMQVVDFAFGGAAVLQGAHDVVNGSVSAGTAKTAVKVEETVTVKHEPVPAPPIVHVPEVIHDNPPELFVPDPAAK